MSQTTPPVLAPTAFRTTTGIAVMAGIAFLLLRAARDQGLVMQALMIAIALGAVALALAIWRGRSDSLEWTDAGLIDAAGQVVAARDRILKIDRNPLSLKPSNGFTLQMTDPQPRAWRPGLYWRVGQRVGVGGLTSPVAAKALADRIALDTAPPAA